MRSSSTRRNDDEDESVFVSMTDMTISFLFIVMILLAFFASQLRNQDTVPRSEYDQVVADRDQLKAKVGELQGKVEKLTERNAEIQQDLNRAKSELQNVKNERDQLKEKVADLQGQVKQLTERNAEIQKELDHVNSELEQLKKERDQLKQKIAELEKELERLKDDRIRRYFAEVNKQRELILKELERQIKIDMPQLEVTISSDNDALRFKGEGLFDVNKSKLAADKLILVERIASRLNAILPCYTIGSISKWKADCNSVGAIIEAVQIEGHTDATGNFNDNLTLSTNRANETFFAMTNREPGLVLYLNNKKQPVLSVAGYGRMRPVEISHDPEKMKANRRIDLRIIMYTPPSLEDIHRAQDELRRGIGGGAQ